MKMFFDTEFTGLHKNTTLISLGMKDENDNMFYAEFTDYDKTQVDDWIRENVISKLFLKETIASGSNIIQPPTCAKTEFYSDKKIIMSVIGDKKYIKEKVLEFVKLVKKDDSVIHMWSDCLAYDWVLFNDIFGTAFDLPKDFYYIPFDICTLFQIKGIDPDITREDFIKEVDIECPIYTKHNALWDAVVIKACYDKLMRL